MSALAENEQLTIAVDGAPSWWSVCGNIVPLYGKPACEIGPIDRAELGLRNCPGCGFGSSCRVEVEAARAARR